MNLKYTDDPTYLEVLKMEKWLVDIRRDFHQYPELSENEYRTQSKITSLLNDMGISNSISANTGVCGIITGKLKTSNPIKTVGIRADIDALPIQEISDDSFCSLNNGVMHACGHDAHATILLGIARYFKEHEAQFSGNIKLFFQPAEETIGGAERMVLEGCMEQPKVDFIIGLHVMPHIEVGKVEMKNGKLNAASDSLKIAINGKAAHGAYPEKGIDAMVISAQVILGLQTMISRKISPLDQAVLTFGKINGGVKNNIICEEVVITGGMRTTDENLRDYLKTEIIKFVEGVCIANGGTGVVSFEPGYNALVNDDEIVEIIRKIGVETLGSENVIEKEHPSLGVEDFSFFLDQAKGAFYHLGCKAENSTAGALHTHQFKFDEKALSLGTTLQIKIIQSLLF